MDQFWHQDDSAAPEDIGFWWSRNSLKLRTLLRHQLWTRRGIWRGNLEIHGNVVPKRDEPRGSLESDDLGDFLLALRCFRRTELVFLKSIRQLGCCNLFQLKIMTGLQYMILVKLQTVLLPQWKWDIYLCTRIIFHEIPEIDTTELIKALNEMKNNKSPCKDCITAEMLNIAGEQLGENVKILLIYGKISEAWENTKVILLYKKTIEII